MARQICNTYSLYDSVLETFCTVKVTLRRRGKLSVLEELIMLEGFVKATQFSLSELNICGLQTP